MPNYNQSTRQSIADITMGLRVDKTTATLPQSTTGNLFNVEIGKVLVTLLVGEVTTIIQNQANNTKLQANPDTGTTTDLCGNLDVANKEAGTLFSITGDAASDAMQTGSSGSVPAQTTSVVVAPGTIDLVCAASNTGSVQWSVWYVPLEDGAHITAA